MQMSLNLHLITEKLNNSAKLFEKLEKYQFSITNSVSDIMSLLHVTTTHEVRIFCPASSSRVFV